MSTTPNFNLPLLTATQSGKEITLNQALTLIDSILAAMGQGGSGSGGSLTQEQLAQIFVSQPQLEAVINAALATLPTPLTLAQLQAELAALPSGSGGGVTLSQLQAELAGLSITAAGVLPSQVVQFYGTMVPTGFDRLTPTADYSRSNVQLGPHWGVYSTSGAASGVAFSGKHYSLDAGRGFKSYDPLTHVLAALPAPSIGFGSASIAPAMATLPDGRVLYVGGSDGKGSETFDGSTGQWTVAATLAATAHSAVLYSLGGNDVLAVGGTTSAACIFTAAPGNVSTAVSLSISATGGNYYSTHNFYLARGCTLPDARQLILLRRNSAPYDYAAFTLAYNPTDHSAVATVLPGFPANSKALAIAPTSSGALAVLRNLNTPEETRLYQFDQATNGWTLMPEHPGSSLTTAAISVDSTDIGLVLTGTGSGAPDSLLVSGTTGITPELFLARKL